MNRILTTLILSICITSFAVADAAIAKTEPLKIRTEQNVANMDMVIKDNFIKAK